MNNKVDFQVSNFYEMCCSMFYKEFCQVDIDKMSEQEAKALLHKICGSVFNLRYIENFVNSYNQSVKKHEND